MKKRSLDKFLNDGEKHSRIVLIFMRNFFAEPVSDTTTNLNLSPDKWKIDLKGSNISKTYLFKVVVVYWKGPVLKTIVRFI